MSWPARVLGADLDAAQGQELGDLGVQHLLGQVPVRDPGPEHPARLVQRLEDHAAVPEAAQVIGGREAGRAGADDGDRGPVQRRQRVLDRLLGEVQAVVAEEALHAADADRLVVLGPVAGRLARVVADPAGDRRHRVVFHDREVAVEVALVLHEVQVLLDLLAGRAGVVARRRLVLVDRPEEPEVAGGEEPLAFFLGRGRGHPGDGQLQVRRDPGAAYGHEASSAGCAGGGSRGSGQEVVAGAVVGVGAVGSAPAVSGVVRASVSPAARSADGVAFPFGDGRGRTR